MAHDARKNYLQFFENEGKVDRVAHTHSISLKNLKEYLLSW